MQILKEITQIVLIVLGVVVFLLAVLVIVFTIESMMLDDLNVFKAFVEGLKKVFIGG
jgi:hypothetical protein